MLQNRADKQREGVCKSIWCVPHCSNYSSSNTDDPSNNSDVLRYGTVLTSV